MLLTARGRLTDPLSGGLPSRGAEVGALGPSDAGNVAFADDPDPSPENESASTEGFKEATMGGASSCPVIALQNSWFDCCQTPMPTPSPPELSLQVPQGRNFWKQGE